MQKGRWEVGVMRDQTVDGWIERMTVGCAYSSSHHTCSNLC